MESKHQQEVILDFETASAAELKQTGAHRYAEDVTTEVLCLSYYVGNVLKIWKPGDSTDALRYLAENVNCIFVAHNAGFEKAIWRNIMVPLYGLPDIPNSRWDDTLAACAMRALPLDLDRATIVLRLANHKDKKASAFTKRLSKPSRKGYYDRTAESLAKVYRYCEQDVLAERDLRQRIGPLPPGERNIWLLDQRINERGIRLDLPFIDAAQRVVDAASLPLAAEFAEITGGLKVTQSMFVKRWVEEQGVFIDNLAKETISAALREDVEEEIEIESTGIQMPSNVRRALQIRNLICSSSIKKLRRMKLCASIDGRVRGTMQYHGAGPGRWAGRLFQPHNFPRGTIKDTDGNKFDPDYAVQAIMSGDPAVVEKMLGPPVEAVVSTLRHSIQAERGRTLLSGDFAGVELRMLMAGSGQSDKTALLASGQNAYCDMGYKIYNRVIDKHKDLIEYTLAKCAVLGLGFGMGWRKFKMKYAQVHPDDFCKFIVKTYREEWAPSVPQMWWELEEAALNTVKTGKPHEAYGVLYERNDLWLTARLPSGRRLWYFNPQTVKKGMPWDETDVRLCWQYQAMKMGQWKTIDAFGGLLTENVIQGLARDLMVEAMFKLEKNGFPIILTVHDEIVCEPLAKDADEKAFQQIMSDSPAWAKRIEMPVAVETWIGDRYRK